MRGLLHLLLVSSTVFGQDVGAQTVFRDDEILAPDRPESWAMNYFAASSLMTAFGESPALGAGKWEGAVEFGHVPRLSDAQQRVGFAGFKNEDLNRSPVFGRLRLMLGLPAGWVAELGYTPPLTIDGTRPHNLVALGVGRRLLERDGFTLSARVFGQHGEVSGDVTCPNELAGVEDGERNPYGCQAPSDDRLTLNYYGIDLTTGWVSNAWHWHAGVGVVRTELQVQVDALTFDVRDRSRLVANDVLPLFAAGAGRDIGSRWSVAMEVLYVPLTVRRDATASTEQDPLTSLRLQIRYRHHR